MIYKGLGFYTPKWNPMDPDSSWEGTYPPNHTTVILPQKVLGSIGAFIYIYIYTHIYIHTYVYTHGTTMKYSITSSCLFNHHLLLLFLMVDHGAPCTQRYQYPLERCQAQIQCWSSWRGQIGKVSWPNEALRLITCPIGAGIILMHITPICSYIYI